MSDEIGVAVLGLGNVGSEVVRIIEESAADLTARIGAPLVIPPANADPDALLGLIPRHGVRYSIAAIEPFAYACREAKRAAKDARRVLSAALLATDGPFEPDQRRRVGKALECPALTFWGLPETGPIFASPILVHR